MPELRTKTALVDVTLALDILPPILPKVEVEVNHADPEADIEANKVAAIKEVVTEQSKADNTAFNHTDSKALLQCICSLQEGQTQQTQLNLHRRCHHINQQ
jgi:hypothetical protein